jgi:hypothetical protein
MEDGDAHLCFEALFDIEAFGGFDIFEVNAAESGLEELDRIDKAVGVESGQFEVDSIYVGKAFEEEGFTFHNGLGSEGADIAEAEDGGAVSDDGDEVTAGCVTEGVTGIALDSEARLGDTGGVGKGEVMLGKAGLSWANLQLARGPGSMIVQSFL